MTETKPMILSTSDEAAQRVTLTGWVARGGQFWGEDERMARWSGATHIPCAECGAPVEKMYVKCEACRQKADDVKWLALERRPYDGGVICATATDRYFFEEDDLRNYLDTHDEHTVESLRLVICDPVYPRYIDGDDYFADELPEDMQLRDCDDELAQWISKANERISAMHKAGRPLSWIAGKFAVDLSTLPADLRTSVGA